jgi:hypothetical protein
MLVTGELRPPTARLRSKRSTGSANQLSQIDKKGRSAAPGKEATFSVPQVRLPRPNLDVHSQRARREWRLAQAFVADERNAQPRAAGYMGWAAYFWLGLAGHLLSCL